MLDCGSCVVATVTNPELLEVLLPGMLLLEVDSDRTVASAPFEQACARVQPQQLPFRLAFSTAAHAAAGTAPIDHQFECGDWVGIRWEDKRVTASREFAQLRHCASILGSAWPCSHVTALRADIHRIGLQLEAEGGQDSEPKGTTARERALEAAAAADEQQEGQEVAAHELPFDEEQLEAWDRVELLEEGMDIEALIAAAAAKEQNTKLRVLQYCIIGIQVY